MGKHKQKMKYISTFDACYLKTKMKRKLLECKGETNDNSKHKKDEIQSKGEPECKKANLEVKLKAELECKTKELVDKVKSEPELKIFKQYFKVKGEQPYKTNELEGEVKGEQEKLEHELNSHPEYKKGEHEHRLKCVSSTVTNLSSRTVQDVRKDANLRKVELLQKLSVKSDKDLEKKVETKKIYKRKLWFKVVDTNEYEDKMNPNEFTTTSITTTPNQINDSNNDLSSIISNINYPTQISHTSPEKMYYPSANYDKNQLFPGSLFDSHCHLDFLVKRLKQEGKKKGGIRKVKCLEDSLKEDGEMLGDKFAGCVTNFCNPIDWAGGNNGSSVDKAVLQADKEDRTHLSIGCHPHFADKLTPARLIQLEKLVCSDGPLISVVSLGECGLDYSAKNKVSHEVQKARFFDQLKLAMKYSLPLVLHIRDAEEDGYSVLKSAGVPSDYAIHRNCFTDDWERASVWLDTYTASKIGITGVVTLPNAVEVRRTVQHLPLERLLLETDSPYFLPAGLKKTGYRWSVSQPGHVVHVAAAVAIIKGVSLREVLVSNLQNVKDIYGI